MRQSDISASSRHNSPSITPPCTIFCGIGAQGIGKGDGVNRVTNPQGGSERACPAFRLFKRLGNPCV
jgi:hypothetical protein